MQVPALTLVLSSWSHGVVPLSPAPALFGLYRERRAWSRWTRALPLHSVGSYMYLTAPTFWCRGRYRYSPSVSLYVLDAVELVNHIHCVGPAVTGDLRRLCRQPVRLMGGPGAVCRILLVCSTSCLASHSSSTGAYVSSATFKIFLPNSHIGGGVVKIGVTRVRQTFRTRTKLHRRKLQLRFRTVRFV